MVMVVVGMAMSVMIHLDWRLGAEKIWGHLEQGVKKYWRDFGGAGVA